MKTSKYQEYKRKAATYDKVLAFFEAGHRSVDTFTFREGQREARVTFNKTDGTLHVWDYTTQED